MQSIYGHLCNHNTHKIPVEIGDPVSKGDAIGYIGQHTCDGCSDDENGHGGEHLHLGLRKGPYNGKYCGYISSGCAASDYYDPTDFINLRLNDTSLTSGTSVTSAVSQGDWKRYTISSTSAHSQLKVQLYGLSADMDLYVKKGGQPSLGSYDCRPYKGGSTSETCDLSNSGANTWHIGVHGYRSGSYTLKATLSGGSSPSVPGPVSVSPSSGSWTSSPKNLSVSSSGASKIYFRMVNTYDGGSPSTPSNPTASSNDGAINGSSGSFQYYASDGQYKRSALKFVGCNAQGCGPVSQTYYYKLDLRNAPSQSLTSGASATGAVSQGDWKRYTISSTSAHSQLKVQLYGLSADVDLYVKKGGQPSLGSYDCRPYKGGSTSETCDLNNSGANTWHIGVHGYRSGSYTLKATLSGGSSPSVPGPVSVSPSSGSWTSSPKNLSVSSSGASKIYFRMVNTYDGGSPSTPSNPTASSNDGAINGSSGTFQYYASDGQYKRSALKFVGCNAQGCGPISQTYYYKLDLRNAPSQALTSGASATGAVSQGDWKRYTISSTSAHSQLKVQLYGLSADMDLYVKKGGPPSLGSYDCRPYKGGSTSETCDLNNSGANTWHIGVHGYRSGSYTLKATLSGGSSPSVPGPVSVSPSSGSWTSSPKNLSVSSSGASKIYFRMVNTYDGGSPSTPANPTASSNDGAINGSSGTFQYYASDGQYKRSSLKFVGCNAQGCGPVSQTYYYKLDLRGSNTSSTYSLVSQGYGVNAYNPSSGSNVNMWSYSSSDSDQRWKNFGSRNIQRNGTNLCLNAHNPGQGSNVNLYTCDTNDWEQQWETISCSSGKCLIRLVGTSYCLNAHSPFNGSNLNMWPCDSSDSEQKFKIIEY